ncbi:hypothetical protein AB0D84_29790 [Streptomyces sp. NPDC048193]|uniref:hypothetical protein n=1 Tax=unclassified Streptomyces TaxID=2593676 RepID=UPI003431BABB
MTDPNARRTTYSFAPPVDNATAWDIDLDDFANRLMQAFPGTEIEPVGALGPQQANSLSFDMPLGGGSRLEGLVSAPYPNVGSVMALDAAAPEAAVLARFLRDHYAPTPDLVHFTSEMALEIGVTDYAQIPPDGGLEEITSVLQAHIDEMDA